MAHDQDGDDGDPPRFCEHCEAGQWRPPLQGENKKRGVDVPALGAERSGELQMMGHRGGHRKAITQRILTTYTDSYYSVEMDLFLLYGTALVLGSVHALEADHVTAVTAFVARNPGVRNAVAFGVRWAAGHGAAVLVLGSALIVLERELPETLTAGLERLVGAVLIGLGVWTVLGARRLHAHTHTHTNGTTHEHVHSHLFSGRHDHRHGATSVGLLHGAAGAGAAAALVPLAGLDDPARGVIYLALFGVGTIAGMGLYALLAGFVVGRTAGLSVRLARAIAVVTGTVTTAVGVIWLLR